MRAPLGYGRGQLELDLPVGRFSWLRPRPPATSPRPPADILAAALAEPVDHPPLDVFLEGRNRLLLVIPDATRQTATAQVLEELARWMDQRNCLPAEIHIVAATGIHRPPTDGEWRHLVGNAFPQAHRLTHRADDSRAMLHFGRTRRGNDVWLNRCLAWADAILTIGGVGFHYFAGFSGGRKSLSPGLAAEDTISFNHRLVFQADGQRHPEVGTGRLAGNPVHEDMIEAVAMVGRDRLYSLQVMLEERGTIFDAVAGDVISAHLVAAERYAAAHSVVVARPLDVVIASAGGWPRDINMIQTHKVLEMARLALRPGGRLLVLAGCEEGMGHPDFFRWFTHPDEHSFRQALLERYVINGQTALAVFEKAHRYRIHLLSDLPAEQVRQMGLQPENCGTTAVKRVLDGLPPDYHGGVMPSAGTTFCRTPEGTS